MRGSLPGHALLAMLSAVIMAGCGTMRSSDSPSGGVFEDPTMEAAARGAIDELFALLDRFSRASPGELAREYESLAAMPEQKRGGDVRVRLALLLSQPGLPFRDDAAASRVLQEWESRQALAPPALKAFVHWLRAMLSERAKLAGGLEDAGARLREEKKRTDLCKDKLEAIKNMERSLIERDKH